MPVAIMISSCTGYSVLHKQELLCQWQRILTHELYWQSLASLLPLMVAYLPNDELLAPNMNKEEECDTQHRGLWGFGGIKVGNKHTDRE